jgi:hypothetical protein
MTEQTTTTGPITEFEITAQTGSDKVLYVCVGFSEMWDVREDGPEGRPLGTIALIHGGAGFGAATTTNGRTEIREFAPPQFADAARWLYQAAQD